VPNKRLRIPQGTEAFYLEEAYVHRKLLRQYEDICGSWGYLPMQTPVFDFHDLYRGLDDEVAKSSYRLVDRDGEILVLRSDITLFLARQMGMIVQPPDLPVRVYYGDTILRHEDPNDLSKNEFFQIGAELIGTAGVEADAEIMLLLIEAADGLGASSSVLHVGSRALLRESSTDEAFARAVEAREWAAASRLLEEAGADPDRVEWLMELYRFIGSADELKDLIASAVGLRPAENDALGHLLSLADELAAVGHADRFLIDLSEVGDRDYYSGIVFHLYDEGADAPVASGGRYDELLGHFGAATPSVGFSLMLRRLQSRLSPESLPQIPQPESAGSGPFRERVANAKTLRDQGKVVRL
jgi:ATP phosphoribosyltransferase regulatory subunit